MLFEKKTFRGDKVMALYVVMVSWVCACLQSYQDVYIKYVQPFCMSIMPQ